MKTLRKWGAVGALTAAAAFPVLAVSGTASAAAGGNSAAAHACQKGGYATLQRTDGTLFNNVGACVSYAAQGGTLEAIPTSYTYSCTVPIIGTLPLTVSISAQAPESAHAGSPVSLHAVRGEIALPTNLVNLALAFGITSLSGQVTTLDFDATNATPTAVNAAPTPLNFGPIPLVENQPATLTIPDTPATVGPWTAGNSGGIAFTPGEINLSALLPISCVPTGTVAPFATTVIR